MSSPPAPIAVVGVGCRLPGGASNLDKLWQLLSEGRSGRTEIPKDRWNADEWFDAYPEAKQSVVTKHGYFLHEDVSQFDNKFFGISSSEAQCMDPQQRLFLMTTYEAFEDAGIPVETLRGSNTGVFAGVFDRCYDRMGHKDMSTLGRTHLNGTGESILSNRISYCFDLQGPCMTIDTGCSGSLVALHQACYSLRAGESDLAVVGGSQIVLHPDLLTLMSGMGMINPEGLSYVFDSRGAGYGRGEGVASIVLKPLDRALADGDRVHAVIANSGVNQDGKTTGINNPSGAAQAELSSRVYKEAGLDPGDTVFVEAHGTGTQVGDREEISSISKVFCDDPGRSEDLYVGSIKSNIGHLEASSGLAGLLKCILVLKHGQIPPNLNYVQPKPSLKLYEKKIKIPLEGRELPSPRGGGAKRVSLNSFGYGGTNCHVIIEDAPSAVTVNGTVNGHTNGTNVMTTTPIPQLFVLSASTEKALSSLAENLTQWASSRELTPQTLRSLSYTLGVHRSALQYRRTIIASTPDDLLAELDQPGSAKRVTSLAPVSFVFSGQGAQWHAMGRELIGSSPCFRQSMEAMEKTLQEQGCTWSLTEELSRSAEDSRVGEAEISQPTTTAVQIALVDLLESLSVRPSRVVGHSSGEIGAAYAAGALSRSSAITVGRFSTKAKAVAQIPGAMMAVSLEEAEATRHLEKLASGAAVVACVNSPSSMTISGDETAIDELKGILDNEGVFARKLKVDTAYHSHHMRRVGSEYEDAINDIEVSEVREGITFYSSVTGAVKKTGFGADYWTSNMVSQVKFSEALTLLRDEQTHEELGMDSSVFIEIGPHSALAGPARQTLGQGSPSKFKFEYLSALVRGADAVKSTLALVGRLFELGIKVDMAAAVSMTDSAKPKVIRDLGSYPWDLSSFWRESRVSKNSRFRPFARHDLLGLLDPWSTLHEPRWRYHISLDSLPWLRDHVVEGFVLYPGAGYMVMAVEAMKQLVHMRDDKQPIATFVLRDVVISKSIILQEAENSPGDGEIEVQLSISSTGQYEGSKWEYFQIWSCDANGAWTQHCTGEISVKYTTAEDESNEFEGTREAELRAQEATSFLDETRLQCDADMGKTEFYDFAKLTGNNWEGSFQPVEEFQYGHNRGVVRVVNPDIAALMPYRSFRPHTIHPITLDAVHQLHGMLFKKFVSNATCVPTKFPFVEISAGITSKPGDSLTCVAGIETDGAKASKSHSWVFHEDAAGELKPVIRLLVNMRAIGEEAEDENRPFVEDKVNRLDWTLDTDFMTQSIFVTSLEATTGLNDNTTHDYEGNRVSLAEGREAFRAADRASLIWIREALYYLEKHNIEITKPHLIKYISWVKGWLSSDYYKEIVSELSAKEEAQALQLIESSPDTAPELQLLARVGKALPSILSGQSEPLAVMLEGNLLIRSYEGGTFAGDYEAAVAYLKILSCKNPRLRFLEIGAGTGGCTKRVLGGLAGQNGAPGMLPVDKYTYTDISSGFFQEARGSFVEWEDYMDFKTLDVERDPLAQGFEPESYDVVIAANVLHATKNMDVTMEHVRRIMRPGGSLILVENQPKGVALSLVFGTLPGWWAHEDEFRTDTALMHREQWSTILSRNGYGGIHVARQSMMVSKAIAAPPSNGTSTENKLVLLKDAGDDGVGDITQQLTGLPTKVATWDQVKPEENATYIIFDRAEKPLLLRPKQQTFKALNSLVEARVNIFWVVLQDDDNVALGAYKGVVTSTIRCIRRESGHNGIVGLDIRHPIPEPGETARIVADIARRSFWPATPDMRSSEPEFAYENGQILVPRIKPDATFLSWARQKWAHAHASPSAGGDVEMASYTGDRALKLEVATPGLLGSLRFVDNDLPSDLAPTEIEFKAEAHGVNFKDVNVALGHSTSGTSMAGEFSGVVVAVGTDMQGEYQVGDRVMGFGAQPFSNVSRVHGHLAYKIPENMSATVAAATPHACATAYHCLMETARLESGQSILIHSASGGVGQAAIQLAKHVGSEIFCTVGSAAKRQFLVNEYSIPEDHIFSSQTDSFKQGILRLTSGEGVDVALGSFTGEALRNTLDCVKTLGTCIQLGKAGGVTAIERPFTFTSFDLASLSQRKPKHVHRVLGEVLALCESKALRPAAHITTFTVDEVGDAFRLISSRKHIGKVVLTIEPTSMVKSLPPKAALLELRKDGTYVIAGGLGNLPTRIARHFAAHGAGHIVSLSRRDIDDETRQQYVDAIEALGGKFHIVKCDITIAEEVQRAADYCSSLPPVRGVVHGALKLQDRTFAQMTTEDWEMAVEPKVFGTINLDKTFASSALDFFVTLSSLACIVGKTGMSNYNAGNGFQDAYMRVHANHPNTQYVSINIGAVSIDAHGTGAGVVMAGLRQNSVTDVTFEEFLANVEYAVSGLAGKDNVHQTIQGITRKSMADAHDTHLLENPIFSQLPIQRERKAAGAAGGEKVDLSEALSRATTNEEAEQLVRDAIVAKFALFLDKTIEEIRIDQSLATIGLDSLVSIEVKNWIVRTFQVNLQTSELGGSGSIQVLTETVVARSKLVSDEVRKAKSAAPTNGIKKLVAASEKQAKEEEPNHNFPCCKASKELPRYPLVDFDEAARDLMTSVGHFAHTREEYTELVRKVNDLIAPGSFGRRLYNQLRARADDPNVQSWIADLLLKALHLKRRYTLAPYGNFLCTHFDSPVPHGQAERAAALTRAICEFKRDRDQGKLEPDFLGTRANCTHSRDWLFNAVREPNVGCDKMMKYEGDFVAVLRRGRLFTVQLQEDGGETVSEEKLRATYQAIIDLDLEDESWAGMLTTDNRDAWGNNRQRLLSLDKANSAYFEAIEASTFVACLDEDSPVTREERVYSGYIGDSFNRWHDKCFQLIVNANGRSASIFEHSMIDVMSTWQVAKRMQNAIDTLKPNTAPPTVEPALLEEISLVTTPDIDAHIESLREKYLAITSSKKYVPHQIPTFGKTLILSHSAPIKATVDLTIQLASRMYFGYLPASWETVSTSHFHLGRPEIVQVVRAEVIEFCDAALDEAVPRAEARAKLMRAAREHNAQVNKGTDGKNYFRLMDVIEVMAQDQDAEPVPEMFADPVWRRGYPQLIMQTMTETKLFEDPGFTMPDPESVWINYSVFEESLEVCFNSPAHKAEKFQAALDRAADMVKTIIAARG